MPPHPSPLVLLVTLVLASPSACRPQFGDTPVLGAEPQPPVLVPAASTRLGSLQEEDPVLRSTRGPEGFAYEVSHPVLDAYGELSRA